MNLTVVILLALLACHSVEALTNGQKAFLGKLAMECLKQSGTTAAAVKEALVNSDTSNVNASVMSYAHCLLNKSGVLVNEVIQPRVMREAYGPSCGVDNVNTIMAKCNGLKGRDNRETAFLLIHCYTKMRGIFKCAD